VQGLLFPHFSSSIFASHLLSVLSSRAPPGSRRVSWRPASFEWARTIIRVAGTVGERAAWRRWRRAMRTVNGRIEKEAATEVTPCTLGFGLGRIVEFAFGLSHDI